MKKILIADDEKSFLLSLQDGLGIHRDTFTVMTAENGLEAVKIMESEPVDLLVTDLKMPEMNGFELLAWVTRHQPQLAVIVLTAFGTPEIESRLGKMTSLQYLEKPVDFDILQAGILKALQSEDKSYIRGITLPTFLQLMSIDKKTCTLKITSDGMIGYLYIRRGELLDAELGQLTGEMAAQEIVGWDNTTIEMDGICRRQKGPINLPLEQLLMEAFRLKDEKQHAQKTLGAEAEIQTIEKPDISAGKLEQKRRKDSHQTLSAEISDRNRLVKVFSALPVVLEFAIFDDNSFLEARNIGKCSLEEFDPVVYAHLIDMVNGELSFGTFSCIVLSTAHRQQYLFFNHRQHWVIALLKPGASAGQVIRELKRIAIL